MQTLIRKVVSHLYVNESIVHSWRAERMRAMVALLDLPRAARVVDLGGDTFNWNLFDHDFHVTLVNLPGWVGTIGRPDRFRLVEADACDLRAIFPDGSFDLAFSNSTIEHVGGDAAQERFAAEVRRLAPAYWVQTPSSRFPIEPHTGFPYYWRLPGWGRERLLRHWEKELPGFVEMVRGTRLITERQLRELFPGGTIYRERRFGFEKSYSIYRPTPR